MQEPRIYDFRNLITALRDQVIQVTLLARGLAASNSTALAKI